MSEPTKLPLTDGQKRALERAENVKRNRHEFESTNPRRPEKCDICGHDGHHPYHGRR